MVLNDLIYIAAGSKSQGTGHLRRSSQIIRLLRSKGLPLRSVSLIGDKADRERLVPFLGDYDECAGLPDEIQPGDERCAVVDVHDDIQPEILPWLHQHSIRTLALDWYTDPGQCIAVRINLRGGSSALKYCIIRDEFIKAKKRYYGHRPKFDAAVVMGGGDRRLHIPALLAHFSREAYFADKTMAVVLGPMVHNTEMTTPSRDSNILFYEAPRNVSDIMARSAVGISNGGSALMEFTMLGIPTIIFPQTEKEDAFIETFLKAGCSILGSLDPNEFARQFRKFRENDMLRREMSEKAVNLVDGSGADRVADEIKKFLRGGPA